MAFSLNIKSCETPNMTIDIFHTQLVLSFSACNQNLSQDKYQLIKRIFFFAFFHLLMFSHSFSFEYIGLFHDAKNFTFNVIGHTKWGRTKNETKRTE